MTPLLDTTAVHIRDVGVVRVSGHDRLGYLHSLLTQDLEGAAAGTCADFLYLDHKANPLAEGRAVLRAGDVLLVVPPEVASGFAEALDRFRFLMDVAVEELHGWALASVRGPAQVRVPGMRSEPMTAAPHGAGMVIAERPAGDTAGTDVPGGADLLGPREWVAERVQELGLPAADDAAWEAWRITACVPSWGSEVAAGRRPQELGLLPTHVHLRKGCYPGQETIAKTWNLGRPRRALALVRFDAPVEAGTGVDAAGKTGLVTSAAAVADGAVALVLLPVDREGGLPDLVAAAGAKGVVEHRVGEGLVPSGA